MIYCPLLVSEALLGGVLIYRSIRKAAFKGAKSLWEASVTRQVVQAVQKHPEVVAWVIASAIVVGFVALIVWPLARRWNGHTDEHNKDPP